MNALIDLEAIARAFVSRAIAITRQNLETNIDAPAIRAVCGQVADEPERERALKKWLRDYAVFQGFTDEMRADVVRQVLQFADDEHCHSEALSHAELIEKFKRLQGFIRKPAKRMSNIEQRDVTSLTSKALWCCYPNAVPIYDRLAQNALWVIGKLAAVRPARESNDTRYEMFSDVWLQVYQQIEPVISEELNKSLSEYPYKVRIFDRMLWSIGQQNYTGEVRLGRNFII